MQLYRLVASLVKSHRKVAHAALKLFIRQILSPLRRLFLRLFGFLHCFCFGFLFDLLHLADCRRHSSDFSCFLSLPTTFALFLLVFFLVLIFGLGLILWLHYVIDQIVQIFFIDLLVSHWYQLLKWFRRDFFSSFALSLLDNHSAILVMLTHMVASNAATHTAPSRCLFLVLLVLLAVAVVVRTYRMLLNLAFILRFECSLFRLVLLLFTFA